VIVLAKLWELLRKPTYLTGEVELDSLDANVLRARHDAGICVRVCVRKGCFAQLLWTRVARKSPWL